MRWMGRAELMLSGFSLTLRLSPPPTPIAEQGLWQERNSWSIARSHSLCSHIYMDPVTEKMATDYAGSHHDLKNIKQPSPGKLPRLLKARMGTCATEAPRARRHRSGTCELSFTVVLCLEAGVHTLGRRLNSGRQPTGKRQQPLPPEISADANLRCFLFKNFIQLGVKIDPRTTSELCDRLWSPPRKSPLVTRTRDSVVLHSH